MHILPSETPFQPKGVHCHAQGLALHFLCAVHFTIVFSLFWMALPSLPFPADSGEETPASEPGLAAQGSAGQSGTDFYLCDEGGRVVVYTCSDNGLPDKRLLRTGIYVNLLPEADALRLKQGLYVTGETALRALLEDLGE